MTDAFASASSTSQARSPRTIAVDNFMRKALRVGDPHDPAQVANALLLRYPDEAERARREQDGLPYSTIPGVVASAAGIGASSAELVQARDDIERDLLTLATSSELKDIRVELVGWGRAIRQLASDGLAAARLALDAVSHDRAMAARRALGDYARLARFLGALNDGTCAYFRRLAQSCDTLAALILVAIGEGLAASGITRSTSMVRVAAGELQSRRNAVIGTLRSLTGSVEAALGQEDWPRGLEAYRNLVRRLDSDGQSDLRSLLEESALAQAMDQLVDLATGASIEGLRELSTASAMLIHRFERLVYYGQVIEVPLDAPVADGPPESPPLTAFISSLQLFVDAFSRMGAGRLLYLARPPIIIYGLYGAGGPDAGAIRLVDLAARRGRVVEMIDCLACCSCEPGTVRAQIMLDYILYSLDRAIDLYAVGTDPDGRGDPERRAAATARLVDLALAERGLNNGPFLIPNQGVPNDPLRAALEELRQVLAAPFAGEARADRLILRELRIGFQAEAQIERLVRSLSPACHFAAVFNYRDGSSLIRSVLGREIVARGGVVDPPLPVQMPAPVASSLASIASERPDFWAGEAEENR
ncbi:MAG: hypothetical protein QOJ27_321 [Sphingomonadales bacterium]|nr:hypothetical protein [Sphingomonadales bacterium]